MMYLDRIAIESVNSETCYSLATYTEAGSALTCVASTRPASRYGGQTFRQFSNMANILYLFLIIFLTNVSILRAEIVEKSAIQDNDNSSLYRLPENVIPESYDVLLLTNVTRGDFSYKGEVTINLRVLEKTKKVILHADKLKILDEKTVFQKIWNDSYRVIPIQSQFDDNETQFHVLTFADDLAPGKYLLKLYFLGEVLDDLFGFYRSSYNVNNETRWIGITQFSPTFARRAFPCMDEPVFKAIFQLRIGHYGNETVTSNTFQESRNITDRPNYYITSFSKTKPMSTYLLGWAVHNFNLINSSKSQIPLWTHLNDSQLPQPLTILAEGPKIFSALEEWTGLSNPLGKLEQFAVPDFNFNGMENWGLIAYRESVPLASEKLTPLLKIHDNLVTISHEYAHSWFGNLVTPVFWNFAWLKEGFATYFAYVAIDLAHKDWRVMDLFPLEVVQSSLLSDSEEHNRTMNGRNVGSPKSAKAALDFVTYDKGASIIRMIADILGAKLFKDAIRSYLVENQYKAVTPQDLYKYLEKPQNSSSENLLTPTPVTIGEVIESWATQPNYPLVHASRVGPRQLLLSQKPFQLHRNKTFGNESRFWWVPLKIVTLSKGNKHQLAEVSSWLQPENSNLLDLPSYTLENSWFVINPERIGYYRVNYDAANWKALRQLLDSDDYKRLPSISRAVLLDDVFNLARAGYENYDLALTLARYLSRETEYEPWITACEAILFLNDKLRDRQDAQRVFRRYAIDLISSIYKQLNFTEHPSDSRIKRMHRNLILSTACSLDFDECVSNAKFIFNEWMVDENKTIPGNLKNIVYRMGIVHGSNDNWIALWKRFLRTDLYSEKEIMMKALALTTNPHFINEYLEFSLQSEFILKKQYRLSIFKNVIAGNSKNIDNVLNYIQDNVKKIIQLREITFLENILSTIGEEITSLDQINKLSQFLLENAHHLEKVLDTGKKAIKTAKDNIAWINNCSLQIIKYLS